MCMCRRIQNLHLHKCIHMFFNLSLILCTAHIWLIYFSCNDAIASTSWNARGLTCEIQNLMCHAKLLFCSYLFISFVSTFLDTC